MGLKLTRSFNSILPEIRSTKAASNLGNSENFVKTLGMEYSSTSDHFCFSCTSLSVQESQLTKRTVLSYSGKIFDPLGLILCVTIVVKIIFQGLWEKGITWDEPLPPDIQHEWLNWRTQLPEISNIRISRCYSPVNSKIIDRQLIGFCDASEKAYCSVVYLRSLDRAGGVHISLIMAKTRVAPPLPPQEGLLTSSCTLWSSSAFTTNETSPRNSGRSNLQSSYLHQQHHCSLLDS